MSRFIEIQKTVVVDEKWRFENKSSHGSSGSIKQGFWYVFVHGTDTPVNKNPSLMQEAMDDLLNSVTEEPC